MKMKKWRLLLVVGLLVSVLLTACGGGNDGEDSGSDDQGTKEQVLHFVNGDTIPSMDPSLVTDQYGFMFITATMEGLYRLGEDGKIEEGIAIDHSVSDDGLTWTFNLRKDAKWSNGDPVTAHDFVYSWRRAVNPETGSEYGPYMFEAAQVKNAVKVAKGELPVEELGVRAEDDYTLVVELENPTPYFESLTTFGTFYPFNQKFVEDMAINSQQVLKHCYLMVHSN